MDDEKDDLEYGDDSKYGDDSSQTETEELLFRPATTASRLSPVLKITAAIIIGVLVFAITLLSLDSSFRTKFIPAKLQQKTCMFEIVSALRSWPLLIKSQAPILQYAGSGGTSMIPRNSTSLRLSSASEDLLQSWGWKPPGTKTLFGSISKHISIVSKQARDMLH